jgi:formylglycine-generating enzyme required for sulfatase activity
MIISSRGYILSLGTRAVGPRERETVAGKIFINYRRDDSAPHALSIAQYMERAFGARNVFIDIDRMRAGQKFPEVLERRLSECKVMIVIIGPGWLGAHDESGAHRLNDPEDWVRLEVGRALARDVTVIPVTVGGAHLPKRGELPEDLRALVDHHAVALTTNGFRSEMAGLRDDIRAIRAASRMSWRIGAGAAAAVIVAAGLWVANHWMAPFFPEKPHRPTLASVAEPPPRAPAMLTTPQVDQSAQRQDEEAKRTVERTQRKADLTQRIAAATDRSELLALMQRETADRPAIESRLEALGYAQVATATAGDKWLRAGGGRDPAESFKDCGGKEIWCSEMVVVPGGHFLMGSPQGEAGRDSSEDDGNKKQIDVTILQPFAVSKFAVTFDQWDACVADHGCNGYRPDDNKRGRGRLPVINVSWNDALAYLAWLSKKTGKTYRLLSEAEREYVTRAGTQTPFWWGSAISTSQANYDGRITYAGQSTRTPPKAAVGGSVGDLGAKTVAVDSFAPNPWGLFQVHGNVWEWVEDCYHKDYADMPSATKNGGAPWIAGCEKSTEANAILRVTRGGSWGSVPLILRSSARDWFPPDARDYIFGFRVARTL